MIRCASLSHDRCCVRQNGSPIVGSIRRPDPMREGSHLMGGIPNVNGIRRDVLGHHGGIVPLGLDAAFDKEGLVCRVELGIGIDPLACIQCPFEFVFHVDSQSSPPTQSLSMSSSTSSVDIPRYSVQYEYAAEYVSTELTSMLSQSTSNISSILSGFAMRYMFLP